jgi:hypothetical protein
LSGFPVEVAVHFGPGFSAIILLFVFFNLLKIIYEREGIRARAGVLTMVYCRVFFYYQVDVGLVFLLRLLFILVLVLVP